MAGGSNGTDHLSDAYLLQMVDDEVRIEPLPSLPLPCAEATGVLLGDQAFVFGGTDRVGASTAMNQLWSLDLSKPQARWKTHAPLPAEGRLLSVAGAAKGQLFIFSGASLSNGQRTYLNEAWSWNPATDSWTRRADLPQPTIAAASPAINAGHDMLLVISGDTGETAGQADVLRNAHPGFSDDVLAYSATTDTWRNGGTFPRIDGLVPGEPKGSQWPSVTVPVVPWNGHFILPMGEMRPRVRSEQVLLVTPLLPDGALAILDWVVICVYLLALVAMGFYFAGREHTTDDFFLAGRRIPWWAAGISIFATQLSAITFMAIPAKAYETDWVYFVQSIGIFLLAPVVAYLFLPFYRRLGLTTAYEYLERRFGLSVRLIGSGQFILAQLGRVAVVVFLPALALSAVTSIDVSLCIGLMGLLAIVYTVLGGIEVVVWSDVMQTFVLFGGALIAGWIMLQGIPDGLSGAFAQAQEGGKLHLVNHGFDWTQPVLFVVVLGALFNNIIPYTSDQAVIQRYLTTPNEKAARAAIWTGGILAIPASILFFALGTLLWAYYRANPGDLAPLAAVDQILPWFIVHALPAGLSGLIIAAVFAAAMSSIDSSMNSVSTAFTTDFWRRRRPDADEATALRVARWTTVIFGIVGTGAALLIASLDIKSVLDLWFMVLGLFASGLCGLFFLGIFTQRPGTAAALSGLAVSAAVNLFIGTWTDINVLLISTFGIGSCVLTGILVGACVPGRVDLEGLTLASPPKPEDNQPS